MAYTSNKKPGALNQATVLGDNDNVVVEQSGEVKRATLSQVEGKVFASKSALTTPSGTEVTIVRQTDGNLRQVPLANIIPAGNITNASISDSAAIADSKLATINTAGKVTNQAVQATSTNTANRIVTRDGSGNFEAGTITATLSGNASTATTAASATVLATGRTIALTGDVTGTTGAFDGSANVSAATTIANNAVTTAKIADANVTTAKIADANVTTAKIADANVTTAKIADLGVTTAKIADANVTTAKIADANVTTAKIADGAVTSGKIADGTIVDADVSASAAIAASKLATAAQESLVPAGAVMPFAMNSAPSGWLAADGSEVSRSTYAALFSAIGTTHGVGNGSTTFNLPDLRGVFVRGSGSQTISGTAYSGTFAAKQQDEFKAHTHALGSRVNSTNFGVGIVAASNSATINGANNSTESTGGTETRPANIALLYCIKF